MRHLTLLTLLFLLLCTTVKGQIPATLSYQGLLTDADGIPVEDAAHTILFKFYTVETEGTPAFTRGTLSVSTFKGLFTVILGNGQGSNNDALPYDIGDTQYWIGIEADGGAELSPRISLTAVPYAFTAHTASNVDGSAITSGTVPNARLDADLQDLADGTLTGSKVGTGISAANITSGTIDAARLPATSGLPVGTIVAFGGNTIPQLWLLCDGSEVDRTTYDRLFTVLSVLWGAGNLTTTFNLPDLRGRFLRGVNGSANPLIDPDAETRIDRLGNVLSSAASNAAGSYQNDDFKNHNHPRRSDGTQEASIPNLTGVRYDRDGTGGGLYDGDVSSESLTGDRGGSETRPKNAYVNFIIKAQ